MSCLKELEFKGSTKKAADAAFANWRKRNIRRQIVTDEYQFGRLETRRVITYLC